MVSIKFVQPDGSVRTVVAGVGDTVMSAATAEGVDGIVAECGGNLMCATCHVYVEDADLDRLPDVQQDEDEMLETTASPRQVNSRLSCQLDISQALDGVVLRVPESQL